MPSSFSSFYTALHLPPYGLHSNDIILCFHLLFAFQSVFISIWVSCLEIVEFPDGGHWSALTPTPPLPSSKLSFLGHMFIYSYSFSFYVSLNPSSNASLPISCISHIYTTSAIFHPHSSIRSPFHSHSYLLYKEDSPTPSAQTYYICSLPASCPPY